jgi:uncharacterized phiE125 gp8 family phage protein
MDGSDIIVPAVSLSEAQAFARVETGEEEAMLAGIVRSASALCESFIGQILIERPFEEILPASRQWQRLGKTPVRWIASVTLVATDGSVSTIPTSDYEVDIDSRGDGWVRLNDPVHGRIRVGGRAGLAVDPNGVPEPLRHGILRLVAHLFQSRDGGGGEPPAAVTALWRPYRRMRLA